MPAPITALTKLAVAPVTVDLCSLVLCEVSCLINRDEPLGVDIWTSLRGVEGAKKGEAGALLLLPFAMAVTLV